MAILMNVIGVIILTYVTHQLLFGPISYKETKWKTLCATVYDYKWVLLFCIIGNILFIVK